MKAPRHIVVDHRHAMRYSEEGRVVAEWTVHVRQTANPLFQRESRGWLALLPLIALYLIAFSLINFVGFERFCTPDMYEDTVIARMMWEQRTFFPDGWVFGNQYYVVATPVLAALFYGLTGSTNLSMALATTVMTLLMVAAFLWMLKPFTDRLQRTFGVLVLLSCILCVDAVTSPEGQILYLLASYYACYVLTLFLVWGDYVRSLYHNATSVISLSYAAAGLMSFATGMQSLRQTAVMALPLAIVECVRMLRLLVRHRAWPGRNDWRITFRAAGLCLANIAGWLFMKWLDVPKKTLYGQISRITPENFHKNVSINLGALRGIAGLRDLPGLHELVDSPIDLFRLAFAAAMAGMVVFFLIAALHGNGRTRGPFRNGFVQVKGNDGNNGAITADRSEPVLVLCLLCLTSLACVLAMNLVLNISLRSIYLFVWYPLIAFSCTGLAGLGSGICGPNPANQTSVPTGGEGLSVRGARTARTAVIALYCLLCLGNLSVSYLPGVVEAFEEDMRLERLVADWLVENGYTRLYGEWVYVSAIASSTDGAVIAGSWHKEPLHVLEYINPLNIYTEEDNKHAVYLLTQSARGPAFRHAEAVGALLTEVVSFEDYRLYTSSKQLMQVP